MSTVLVTGGAGFIGSWLVRDLLTHGFSVRVLDSLSPQVHGEIPANLDWLKHDQIEFVRGSVTVPDDLAKVVRDVDFVVHLAAETGTGQSMYQMAHYNDVNSLGTALLLEAIQLQPASSIKKVILASSRSVYGEGAFVCPVCSPDRRRYPEPRSREALAAHRWNPICTDCGEDLQVVATSEDSRINPASIYAATKYAQEDLFRIGAQALGASSVVLRFQNVYGEGQSLNNPYTGILSIFSTRIRQGKSLPIFEDGEESRDFVHVSDVSNAIVLSLLAETGNHAVFNVGYGQPVSVMDIATMLVDKLGGTIAPHITGEYRIGDIRHCYADISHISKVLGYQPKISVDQGLTQFVSWVKSQAVPLDQLDKANAELRRMKLMA